MKKLLLLPLLLCLSGCASVTVTKTIGPSGTNTVLKAKTLFSNTAFKNLNLDGTSKTTSSLLRVSGATNEPNPESITATGDALGTLIGTAAATAAKGMGAPTIPTK